MRLFFVVYTKPGPKAKYDVFEWVWKIWPRTIKICDTLAEAHRVAAENGAELDDRMVKGLKP